MKGILGSGFGAAATGAAATYFFVRAPSLNDIGSAVRSGNYEGAVGMMYKKVLDRSPDSQFPKYVNMLANGSSAASVMQQMMGELESERWNAR